MATVEEALKAMRIAHERGETEKARKMARLANQLRAKGSAGKGKPDFMGQVNAGIADVVDFFNPLDTPAVSQALGMGDTLSTGPAGGAMRSVGINAATEQPSGFVEGLGRGGGAAAASFVPTAKVVQAAGAIPGAVGRAARDIYGNLLTRGGAAAEVAGAGLSRGAEEEVEAQGGGPLAQGLAAVAAPMALPAIESMSRGAFGLAEKTPIAGGVIKLGRDVKRSFLPMTEGGAREVAREAVLDAAGGPRRAEALSRRIDTQDPLGRTGPEQTGDSNLIGMQRAAMEEYPEMGALRETQTSRAGQRLANEVRAVGGDPADARKFFEIRRQTYKDGMQARVDNALRESAISIEGFGPRQSEATNSSQVVQRIKMALDDTRAENSQMWSAVPLETDISGGEAAKIARDLIESTPRAQQEDIPATIRAALDGENELAGPTSAKELHGLYSKLRQIARNARAGTNTNTNMARIADDIAEGILEDLDTLAPNSELGARLRDAIQHTRAMHETFDQGATGRVLRRTNATDEQIAPEVALDRTIGRGGSAAFADDQNLRAAANEAGQEIGDYLRSRFSEAVFDASGDVRLKSARTWLRNNREVLGRYPELRKNLMEAVSTRERAEAFSIRAQERAKLADQGPLKDFSAGQIQKAAISIIGADDPAKAARSIMAAARKDPYGKAVDGVKGAFTDYLIADPEKFGPLLSDKRVSAAMRVVFSPEELRKLKRLGVAQKRMTTTPNERGELLNTPANVILDTVVRMAAATTASKKFSGSGFGGSMQAAQMASSKSQKWLRNLTNAKAREILRDAVLKDPELFKELLRATPRSIDQKSSRLGAYLTGAAAAQTLNEETAQ